MSENELPEGWAQVPFEAVLTELRNGVSTRPELKPPGTPILRINAVRPGRVLLDDLRYLPRGQELAATSSVRDGDLLFTRYNGSLELLGVCGIVRGVGKTTLLYPDKLMRARLDESVVTPPYVELFFRSPDARERLVGEAKSSAGQQGISGSDLRRQPLAIAPLAEQRRIVEKVESLLTQVNAAKTRLAKLPLLLKRFRQSILSAACSGQLTEDWRSQRKPSESDLQSRLAEGNAGRRKVATPTEEFEFAVPDGWFLASLDEAAGHLTSGSRAWSQFYSGDGYGTFVMAQNVRPLQFDCSFRQGVAPPKSDPERERTRVRQDDILITIVGANTGDVCRVDRAVSDHFVCQSVALVRPVLPQLSRYLELWLNSPSHGQHQYRTWMYGEGRPHLSFDHLRETSVALPPLDEQAEIVRRVEALFALADAIERRVTTAIARADALPQSILSKAFRGDLVPTEASLARAENRDYEPASALLERIQRECSSAQLERPGARGRGAQKSSGGRSRGRVSSQRERPSP